MNASKTVSDKEFLDAIKTLLRNSGYLNNVQAEIRGKVIEILQEQQRHNNQDCHKFYVPVPPDEVLLINDLIREYLEWNGYLYTTTVMTSEAGMPEEKRTRVELCAEVGVKDDEKSSALPLLTNIVAAYTERIKRKINKIKKEGS
ncbi:unnamed protein product [Parnassius mnemosyne]|uniref:FGFR1 oncogene partner (FOP) N-terminal dimerisation domain-containing protein n=1 Tax=Parnassius mnemosyne TaxID=213953 RepID=A0AAV1LXU6_9NEOP